MFSMIVVLFFCFGLGFLFLERGLDVWFIGSYLLLSFVAFICYGIDKRNAIKGRWRVSEKILHLWAVIGGWPGALVAQKIFRHKTQKRSFIMMLWLSIIANISVFSCYLYLTRFYY
jgi:uncharacterized membrane protein YsdA (DUF1294 family)